MSAALRACVVDASAALQLFLPEPLSSNAERVFAVRGGRLEARIHVPGLFYAECANVLWKTTRRLRLPDSTAVSSMQEVLAMDLLGIPTPLLVEAALQIALAHAISAYDACYVAASGELRVPLVTADRHLVHKLRGSPYDVRWLGEI